MFARKHPDTMAFLSSDGTTQHGAVQAPPKRPILTSICNVIGSLEIMAGFFTASGMLPNYKYGLPAAAAVLAASLCGALVVFGIGQAVSFLARTAAAAERTAQAAERTATLAERNELRTTAAP